MSKEHQITHQILPKLQELASQQEQEHEGSDGDGDGDDHEQVLEVVVSEGHHHQQQQQDEEKEILPKLQELATQQEQEGGDGDGDDDDHEQVLEVAVSEDHHHHQQQQQQQQDEEKEEEEGCKTPTSSDHKIPTIQSCPPTPKKKVPQSFLPKRKLPEFQFFEATNRDEVESFFKSSFELSRVDDDSRPVKRRCRSY